MVEKNLELIKELLVKYPNISQFTDLNPANTEKNDIRFQQVFDSIVDGFYFIAGYSTENLNLMLETILEKSKDMQNANVGTKGILTSGRTVYGYNVSNSTFDITSQTGNDRNVFKYIIKPQTNTTFNTKSLIATYGIASNDFANGVSTKEIGGSVYISQDNKGNISKFSSLSPDDKRHSVTINERELTEEEKAAERETYLELVKTMQHGGQ